MNFKKLIFGLLLSTVLFSACSKNDSIDDVSSKIQHKWGLTDALIYAGPPVNDTIIYIVGTPADYFDFKVDGKLHTSINGENKIEDYTILPGNKIMYDNKTFSIRTLTNSKLQLYIKVLDGSGSFQESTINLKR